MTAHHVHKGYIDVKVSGKVRRRFTPWKAWHRQWCEIEKKDSIEHGALLTLRIAQGGEIVNSVLLPRSSILCRIESRSKQYGFGVFTVAPTQKALIFLSGSCESDTQKWMQVIRRTLCIATYFPATSYGLRVSLVDNSHSRTAALNSLYGFLTVNSRGINIYDESTGEDVIKWKWHQFHQFHLQAVVVSEDENKICVFHTSREFPSGAGQLYFYCEEAPQLLEVLVARGKNSKLNSSFLITQRLSVSESDLSHKTLLCSSNGFRNLGDSDDSGVRVSISSEETEFSNKNKNSSSASALFKTPGGSEVDDEDLAVNVNSLAVQSSKNTIRIPRGESGISLASGIYEEILETKSQDVYTNGNMAHLYEELEGLSNCVPPPLPPRIFSCKQDEVATSKSKIGQFIRNSYKCRSNTLPAKDLRRLSQTLTTDSDYMIMMMPKNRKNKCKNTNESLYVPMSPIVNLKAKIESCYMVMSGKKS